MLTTVELTSISEPVHNSKLQAIILMMNVGHGNNFLVIKSIHEQ